jgi:Zn-dependent M28 family amino/carboxypeptidase
MRGRKGQGRWIGLCTVALVCLGGARQLAAAPGDLPAFSGGRAFEDLKRLVAFGPRPSGSNQLGRARDWMIAQLRQTGAHVEEDRFTAATPIGQLAMSNLIVKIPGATPDVVIVAGHYDTARIPGVAFVGANDGGSSAALLMELARALAGRKYPFTLWLVLFDGEEATQQWSDSDSLYGSRHLVQQLTASGELSRIKAMVLVDMIGDAHLNIHPDANSTAWLNTLIFQTADRLGYKRYFPSGPIGLGDDHIPFINAGVAAVDLLGNVGPAAASSAFGSYWHTAQDTVEHCNAVSLTIVGRVVLAALVELGHSPHLK